MSLANKWTKRILHHELCAKLSRTLENHSREDEETEIAYEWKYKEMKGAWTIFALSLNPKHQQKPFKITMKLKITNGRKRGFFLWLETTKPNLNYQFSTVHKIWLQIGHNKIQIRVHDKIRKQGGYSHTFEKRGLELLQPNLFQVM